MNDESFLEWMSPAAGVPELSVSSERGWMDAGAVAVRHALCDSAICNAKTPQVLPSAITA